MDGSNHTVLPPYLGYISLFVSSAFYGLSYVPVKKYETGDGIFFQLVVCIGESWKLRYQIFSSTLFYINGFSYKPSGSMASLLIGQEAFQSFTPKLPLGVRTPAILNIPRNVRWAFDCFDRLYLDHGQYQLSGCHQTDWHRIRISVLECQWAFDRLGICPFW